MGARAAAYRLTRRAAGGQRRRHRLPAVHSYTISPKAPPTGAALFREVDA